MRKTIYIIGCVLTLPLWLAAMYHIFSETNRFLHQTLDSVRAQNVSVEICPINTDTIPKDCPLFTDQETAMSSLLNVWKQLPPGHAVSEREFFFRIHFVTDGGPGIYCLIAHQYQGWEKLLFLSHMEPEVSCTDGKFKIQAGSLATDNFLLSPGGS